MNNSTRRFLAVTLAGALVSTPALAFGGAAQASTVAPRGLLDGVVGGLLGGITGSTDSAIPAPVAAILDGLTAPVTGGGTGSTGASDPVAVLGSIAGTVTDALKSGDPTALISDLTQQLATVPGGADAITALNALSAGDAAALTGVLLGALPVTDLFGGAIPGPIQDLLDHTSTPKPSNTDELITAMTKFYESQAQTKPSDKVAQALPPSVLMALLAALEKRTPAAKPTRACTAATARVAHLQRQLRAAHKHHQRARAHALTKRLAGAKRAKRRAC